MGEKEVGPTDPHYREKYLDGEALIRFFEAREHKPKKAVVMWKKWVDWRIEFKIDDITLENVMTEYVTGKAFIHK